MSAISLDTNKLVSVLQRKLGELTSTNVAQEVLISMLQDSNSELTKQLADLSTHLQEQPKTIEPTPSTFNTVPLEQLTDNSAVQ